MKKPERKHRKQRLKEYRKLLMSDRFADFEYTSILEIEKLQFGRLKKSIESETYKHEGWEEDIKWIKLLIKIIDMQLTDNWWYIKNNKCQVVSQVNTRNINRFVEIRLITKPDSTLKMILYEEKLWNLYCLIRKNKMRQWWT